MTTAKAPNVGATQDLSSPALESEEDDEWIWIVGGGFVVMVLLVTIVRRRRASARRGIELEARRTQFQMLAIDPAALDAHAAAWERGPTIMPTAIEPEMMRPRRARLAEGTTQPPIANPQPLIMPSVQQPPAPYPLTFPAFPDAAGIVMLPSIEPSGLRDPYPERDYAIAFARGSQPVEHLEPIRASLPMTLPADAKTQIAATPRRSDTLRYDGGAGPRARTRR